MDRFVAHCVATAVITAALAAIPTVLAQPSRAAAAPVGTAAAAAGRTEPSIAILPAAAVKTEAEPGPGTGAVCADAYQVGPTVYARWHSQIIFSVKQFYSPSCHARYSYGFPWLSFRDQHVDYDVGLAVFDVTHDSLDGGATYLDGIGSPDYWSAPVPVTPGSCSKAVVHLFLPDDETDTYTSEFCL